MGSTAKDYQDVACLPECEDHHAEDCPRFEAEKAYYRQYFGVGTPAFENFAPLVNKWCPYCQRVLKVSSSQNECPVCNREELQ
jgi:hypothetical protein